MDWHREEIITELLPVTCACCRKSDCTAVLPPSIRPDYLLRIHPAQKLSQRFLCKIGTRLWRCCSHQPLGKWASQQARGTETNTPMRKQPLMWNSLPAPTLSSATVPVVALPKSTRPHVRAKPSTQQLFLFSALIFAFRNRNTPPMGRLFRIR